MTEAEWLASADPREMAGAALAAPRASDRTCRLFAAAFWDWQAPRLAAPARWDLRRRVATMERWAETGKLPRGYSVSHAVNVIFFNHDARVALNQTVLSPNSHWGTDWEEALRVQPLFLRDIFGNPFRPVAVEPSWLTADALALARGIYEEKAFDRMPILADALQDAGCDNEDVLAHCRDVKQTHVRGCWVLDLLLGKG
jgi:hypothetical protein